MKNQLGYLTTLMVLSVMALCWAGCSNSRGYNDCYQPCGPVCETVCDPCPGPCEPCDPCDPCDNRGNSSYISCDGVKVTASQPKLCILGDNYAMDICIQACTDVCHVDVHAILPEGVTFIRSEPEGVKAEDEGLHWNFNEMKKGDTKHSRVILRADREGDICVCFCVTAVPVQFCTVLCAKPVLECCKCGPEEVCPGDPVHYTLSVTNKGTCPAEDVVITDHVPDGLEHSSGQRELTFRLGDVCPCQTKKVNVCFTACKRGKVTNRITVNSCNANPTTCQFTTNICKECVELHKVGPKEVRIGQNADYQITVVNPGDKSLTQVIVCDQAPSATTIVDAPGASINGNQAVWRVDEIKAGERRTFDLTLTTCTPGYFVNRVSVDNCQRCRDCAEWGTRWKGTPALNACFSDSKDPICIGDVNCYTFVVTNQGSEEDTNLNVVIRFPKQLMPVSVTGDADGVISGQTVTFKMDRLGARETVEFRVDARAEERGDARIHAEVSSDTIRTPIVQQESTIIN